MGFRGLTINTADTAEPHVYAENDAAIYQAILGNDDMLLNYGQTFKPEITGSYSVRLNSGLVSVQGHLGIIEINDSHVLTMANGTSGVTRHDLIVAEFTTTGNHGIDTFDLKVLKGDSSGALPTPKREDLNGGGKVRQIALVDVTITGLSVTSAVVIPRVATSMSDLLYALNERISYGTKPPTGGKDGDIYIMYTN